MLTPYDSEQLDLMLRLRAEKLIDKIPQYE